MEQTGGIYNVCQSSQFHSSSPVEDESSELIGLQPTLQIASPSSASAIEQAIQGIRRSWSSASPGFNQKRYLWKVPNKLRRVNESAYEPQLISIGPYYHGARPHLIQMQVYKTRCLEMILKRKGKQNMDSFVRAMKLQQARKWYSPPLSELLDDPQEYEKFKEMMLLDGCFIVMLLTGKLPDVDPILDLDWVRTALLQDLLLLENQLPFFVLLGLSGMLMDPSDDRDFASLAFSVLSDLLPGPEKWIKNSLPMKDTENIQHLLSLVHDNWFPSLQGRKRHGEYSRKKPKEEEAKVGEEGDLGKWKFTLLAIEKRKEKKLQGDIESSATKGTKHNSFKLKFICCARQKESGRKGLVERQSLRCATELKEAGIQFKNSTNEEDVESLFDVGFTNATMKIPTIVVQDSTESLFRNLIAHELYEESSTYVIDYMRLMDNLINTAKDVQLLRFEGIIENLLGDDEVVAKLFNKLGDYVTYSVDNFYYEEIFAHLRKHCARRWNTWKAKLRHDYFNNPWVTISFFAALLVILLTIGQFTSAVIPLA